MPREANKPERRRKKSYKKPTIRSAQFYEKRALACCKQAFGGGCFCCTAPGFNS